ncbi:MAG TPA: class I SAM-dependent methyltransferase [Planctomycetota bacterium]|nr:class I SAM-dependent methyltransferase [Planctomycetota bacterium]
MKEKTSTSQEPACPICGTAAPSPFRFQLLRCTTCTVILNPVIYRSGTAEILNEETFGDGYEPERSFWVRWFNSWKNRRYLGYLRDLGVTQGRLLEVGVGSGSFLRAARSAGFTVTGCDLSETVCRRIEERWGIPMHRGSLDLLPPAQWDVVVMNHVLEHVQDPVDFLRAARRRLRPGGVLHVAVPNVACIEALFPGWNCYLPCHLSYFTPQSLSQTLRRAGFQVERRLTHENFSTWFLTGLRTLLGVSTASSPALAASLRRVPSWWPLVEFPYRLLMVGTGFLTTPLRKLQSAFERGDEVIALARA